MPDETFTSGDISAGVTNAGGASPASDQQGAPTEQPGGGNQTNRGPIPLDRHESILEGVRRDYDGRVRELEERLTRLSWAERYDPTEIGRAIDAYTALSRQGSQAQLPGPDVRDERGETFYSPGRAAELVKFHVGEAVEELRMELAERLDPIEARDRMQRQQADIYGDIDQASTWPGFAEHVEAITARIAEANRQRQKLSLHQAYMEVVAPDFVKSRETLTQEIRKQIVDEMEETSARTRDDVNPRRQPVASHKSDKDKSFNELFKEEFAARRA